MKLYYLHGFASSAIASTKVRALETYYHEQTGEWPQTTYVEYDPEKPVSALVELDNLFAGKNLADTFVVGTSLGGFWAAYCAITYNIPAILINPSTEPHKTLKEGPFEYYEGGAGMVTETDLEQFAFSAGILANNHSTATLTVCLAADDDVLDFKVANEMFKDHEVIVSLTGGHRFDGEMWNDGIVPQIGPNFFAMTDS